MLKLHPFLTVLLLLLSTTILAQSDVVINEVDCDQSGTDLTEFIELYGPAGTSLDGMVVVCFNGLDDAPYLEFDLTGFTLDAGGFMVIGTADVPNMDLMMSSNSLQNGPEAIALYAAAPGTITGVVTDETLLDAIVYGTNDADDLELLALLNPGQPQVNESAGAGSGTESMSRVPNGGTPRNTDTYVTQLPTPGASNIEECNGGTVFEINDTEPIEICSDLPAETYEFDYVSGTSDSEYFFVVTNNQDEIVLVPEDELISFAGLPDGECRVYGVSYTGVLDESTLDLGNTLEDIESSACVSISGNYVTVLKENCTPPSCTAGEIVADGFGPQVVMCLAGGTQELTFSFDATTDAEGTIAYVLTNADDEQMELLFTNTYDFSDLDEGVYHMWGLVYTGALFQSTVMEGDPVMNIDSDGDCTELSTNYVEIQRLDCVAGLGCDELFISEYAEGTSNNKALEIVNPTDAPIDLAAYSLHVYNNGATSPSNTFNPTGTIAPGGTYVIVSPDADPSWQAYADALSQVTWFSGNDPVALLKDGQYIDIMGEVGYSGSSPILVSGGDMELHTLRRKIQVTQPTTDWDQGQGEWEVFPANTIDGLGTHVWIPCDQSNEPQVTFQLATSSVTEGEVAVISVEASNVSVDIDVTIELDGGTATAGEDYTDVFPIEMTFTPGGASIQNVVFLTTDDEDNEPSETVVIDLSTSTENVNVALDSHSVTIVDNDPIAPLYLIQDVSQVDADGVADSLGVYCELRGLVYGYNLRPEGLQFTLADTKDGIGVFSDSLQFDYTVQEGDSLHIIGTIDQFYGLTQIIPDSILWIDSDQELEFAEPLDFPLEDRESELMVLDCVSLVDPSQWTNEEPGFNVEITDGEFVSEMRIDADVDLFGSDPIEGVFHLVGIGGQFDPSSPYTEGYQVLPRYTQDITTLFDVDFTVDNSLNMVDLQINGVDTCITPGFDLWEPVWQVVGDAADYVWTINGQNAGTGVTTSALPTDWSVGEDLVVSLSATLDECTYTVTHTYCSEWADYIESSSFEARVFPNPTQGRLNIQSTTTLDRIQVFAADGRLVSDQTHRGLNAQLNTQDWIPGSYLLVLHAGNRQSRVRVIR